MTRDDSPQERLRQIGLAALSLWREAAAVTVAGLVVYLFPGAVTFAPHDLDGIYYLGMAMGFLFGSLASFYAVALMEEVDASAA